MKKRYKFKCWNCQRDYSLIRDLESVRQLVVACPYCEKEAVVDLRSDNSAVVNIFKSDDQPVTNPMTTLTLPDVIPTTQPEE